MRRRGFQCASAAQSARMVSEMIRKPSIKQIAENMGRSRNAVAHHVKQGPKLLRGRPLELPCLPLIGLCFCFSRGALHGTVRRSCARRKLSRSQSQALHPKLETRPLPMVRCYCCSPCREARLHHRLGARQAAWESPFGSSGEEPVHECL